MRNESGERLLLSWTALEGHGICSGVLALESGRNVTLMS